MNRIRQARRVISGGPTLNPSVARNDFPKFLKLPLLDRICGQITLKYNGMLRQLNDLKIYAAPTVSSP